MMENLEIHLDQDIHKINNLRDFILNNYSLLISTVEIIAAVAAIIVYRRYKQTKVKYFLFFLVYVAILEIIGGYPEVVANYEVLKPIKEFLKGTWAEQNYWWYNIFWKIVAPLFYSYYFKINIDTKWSQKTINVLQIIFLASAITYIAIYPNELFDNSIVFNTVIGSFLVLVSIALYFIELLRSELLMSFYKAINFYIASIVFIWYLVVTPLVFYNIYFSTADWSFVLLRWEVFFIMNSFMYLSFAVALIFCKPEKDYKID